MTYSEVLEAAIEMADRLNQVGVGPGVRVGICLPSGTPALYISILAVILAGASYVPVDFEDGHERRDKVFAAAQVAAVIDSDGISVLMRGMAVSASALTLDDDAYVIFTSGSTGEPKGVAVTHRSIGTFLDGEDLMLCVDRPLGPGDRVLAGLSVGFDSSVEEIWLAWKHGATLVPASREIMRSGPDIAMFLRDHSVTVMSTVPSLARFFIGVDLPDLRLLILGGEAVTVDLVDALAIEGREVWNSYGPTESTVGATFERLVPGETIYIGRAIAGTAMQVIDAEGLPVAVGETGELVIAGVGLGRYLDPELDRDRFRPLPSADWARAYFTGDFVRLEERGLAWVGRRDEQVKVAGRRIELGEVESAALSVSGVSAAAAVVHAVPGGAKRLVCYVTGTALRPADVARELASRLPSGTVPRVVVMDSMPLTTNGKVDKRALPDPDADVDATAIVGIEDPIRRAWAKALGTVDIADSDSFFDLGGSSVAAAQVIVELREHYPMCSVSDLYAHPALTGFRDRMSVLSAGQTANSVRSLPVPRGTQAAQLALVPVLLAFQSLRWLAGILVAIAVVDIDLLTPGWISATWWLAAFMMLTPLRVVATGVVVRLLTLAVRGRDYQRGGVAHLSLWAAQRIVVIMGVSEVAGSALMVLFARIIGCTVGRGVFLGAMPPITGRLTVSDYATVEPGVRWSDWVTVGDRIQVCSYVVGSGARVGSKAAFTESANIGEKAEVRSHTLVTSDVEVGTVVSGSPMRTVAVEHTQPWPEPPNDTHWSWSLAYAAGLVFASSITALSLIPDIILFETYAPYDEGDRAVFIWAALWSPVLAVTGVLSYALAVGLSIRLLGRWVPAGQFPVASRAGLASWLIELLGTRAIPRLITIYSSYLTPLWFRMLGAKVGRGVECSTLVGQYSRITIADRAFLADNPGLAQREVNRGWVRVADVSVGSWSFLGNQAFVPRGRNVPARTSLGVSSELPEHAHERAMYFGSPALEFPLLADYDLAANAAVPTTAQKVGRAGFELLRIVPLAMLLIVDTAIAIAMVFGIQHYSLLSTVVIGALALFAGTLVCLLLTVALKWVSQGRVRPGTHPFWSPFVWKSEFMWAVVSVLALPWLETALPGTPYVVTYHRLMGAHFGKGVWCECLFISEHDNVDVGDGVSLGPISDLQTHMFAGHNLVTGRVSVGDGATIGGFTHVLLGSVLGDGVTVAMNSAVPRGEVLPPGTSWWGHPAIHRA